MKMKIRVHRIFALYSKSYSYFSFVNLIFNASTRITMSQMPRKPTGSILFTARGGGSFHSLSCAIGAYSLHSLLLLGAALHRLEDTFESALETLSLPSRSRRCFRRACSRRTFSRWASWCRAYSCMARIAARVASGRRRDSSPVFSSTVSVHSIASFVVVNIDRNAGYGDWRVPPVLV